MACPVLFPLRGSMSVNERDTFVVGLLATFPAASSGGPSTQIDFKANDSSGSPSSNKVRERLQQGNTGATNSDPSNKLLDRSQSGKSVTGSGGTTTSTTSGALQGDAGDPPGRRPPHPPCV